MSLFRNSFLNILGSVLPAIVAIPALGYMARELDPELFGVAVLIWALVGYAGIFDAGLGKAVVRHISICAGQKASHGKIVGTALSFVVVTGSLVCILIYALAEVIVGSVFNVAPENYQESVQGLVLAAFCIPSFLAALILQSYFEGLERFRVFNIYRTISGVVSYVFPVIGLYWFGEFSMLIAGLLVARLGSLLVVMMLVGVKINPSSWKFDRSILAELISFGGWLTVTNIVSPFMVYMDRFVIAKLTGAQSVAFYAAPAELVNRMSILPVAVTRAVFPRLAALEGQNESAVVRQQAYLFMLILVAPIAFAFILAAPWMIEVWLGREYVSASSTIFQIMLFGFFCNSLALVPYTSLQAKGKSFLTAKIHLFEVVPYLALLLVFVMWIGVEGGALVWALRMFLDFFVMQYFDAKMV